MTSGESSTAVQGSPTPIILNYARDTPRWRKWLKRLLPVIWLAGLTWLIYDKWGITARLWVEVKLRERACLNYAAPADRVVLELDERRASLLSTQPGYRLTSQSFRNSSQYLIEGSATDLLTAFSIARLANAEYTSLYEPSYEERTEAERKNVIRDFSGGLVDFDRFDPKEELAVIFLHSRKAGSENSRLVYVKLLSGHLFVLRGRVDSDESSSQPDDAAFDKTGPQALLRMYIGQPDPADESQFFISYVTAAGSGQIAGRVAATNRIEWSAVSGPLVGTKAWSK